MPPVARVGDQTAHGTPLGPGPGSPDVLVDGRPAWRAIRDTHVCPLSTGPVPHGAGVVSVGSPTVLINGVPATRMGDVVAEAGPPNAIASGSPTVFVGGGARSVSESEVPDDQPPWADAVYQQLASNLYRYNDTVDEVGLGLAGDRLRDERVNLFVTGDGGEAAYSFAYDGDVHIDAFRPGRRDDATIRMDTDRATVDRITGADDPARAFRDAIVDDAVVVSGVGLVNELEWAVVNVAIDVAEFFGVVQ